MAKKVLFAILFASFLSACAAFVPDDFSFSDDQKEFNQGVVAFNGGQYDKALQDLKAAADKGIVDDQYLTGLIYVKGLTGKTNFYQAEKYLLIAAEQGHLPAQIQLAHLYANEESTVYDPEKAYLWFLLVCEDRPEYENRLGRLRWIVRNKSVLNYRFVQKRPRYKGLDYTPLFPPM